MVDRGDLGQGLAILSSIVGAALSWAAGLGVITILFSVGLGSLLTYIVGTKTQKTAWKREAALRKVDDIYGPLYYELNKIYRYISEPSQQYYSPYDQNQVTWESIQATYKYYLVDPPLRKELDDFFALFKQYNANYIQRSRIVEEKLLPKLRNAFGQDVQAASYQVSAQQQNGMGVGFGGSTMLEAVILAGEHPLEFVKKQYPGYTNYQLEVSVQRAGTMQPLFTVHSPNAELSSRFDQLVASTIDEVKRDSRIVLVEEQRRTLISQAESIKEKLRVKTEEPWRV